MESVAVKMPAAQVPTLIPEEEEEPTNASLKPTITMMIKMRIKNSRLQTAPTTGKRNVIPTIRI